MRNRFITFLMISAIILSLGLILTSCGEDPAVISIEYNLDGGKLQDSAPKSYEVGKAPDFTEIVPTKKHCKFDGWYTDSGYTQPFDPNSVDGDNVVLYAKWSGQEFLLDFVLDGGTCDGLPDHYVYGESTDLTQYVPIKSGYIFEGWFMDYSYTMPADVITSDYINDIMVYAKWRSAPTKVSEISDITKGYIGDKYNTVSLDISNYVNTFGSIVSYTVTSSDTSVATAQITGSTLTVTILKETGKSDITLDVSIGTEKYLTFEFQAYCKKYTNICCVGDSLTVNTPAYTEYLKEFFGNDINVGFFGKSGASLSKYTNNDAYGCYKEYGKAEYEASLEFDADVIIIMLGTNDASKLENGVPKFDWNIVGPAFKADYIALINEYKMAHPQADIILMTSPEVIDGNKLSISNDILEQNTYPLQLEVAKETGVKLLDLRAYLKDVSDQASLFRDNVHFTEFGARMIAEFVYKNT